MKSIDALWANMPKVNSPTHPCGSLEIHVTGKTSCEIIDPGDCMSGGADPAYDE
jgi:hypothetical protein